MKIILCCLLNKAKKLIEKLMIYFTDTCLNSVVPKTYMIMDKSLTFVCEISMLEKL